MTLKTSFTQLFFITSIIQCLKVPCSYGTLARTILLEKWSNGLDDPVIALKFVESKLVILTKKAFLDTLWWMDMSTKDAWLLFPRCLDDLPKCENQQIPKVHMYRHTSFVYRHDCESIARETKSSNWTDDNNQKYHLWAPAPISTWNVGDFVCRKGVVVAGCVNGMIEMWNTSQSKPDHRPLKSLQGHSEVVVSLCFLNGHLLSLDQSGKLLMWSGHDLENEKLTPAPRVLAENLSGTSLIGHERWFASCSSKDDIINIWTLPDLWLRTG